MSVGSTILRKSVYATDSTQCFSSSSSFESESEIQARGGGLHSVPPPDNSEPGRGATSIAATANLSIMDTCAVYNHKILTNKNTSREWISGHGRSQIYTRLYHTPDDYPATSYRAPVQVFNRTCLHDRPLAPFVLPDASSHHPETVLAIQCSRAKFPLRLFCTLKYWLFQSFFQKNL